MSVISKFESKVEGAVDGAAAAVFKGSIEPAQIAKKAEKQMKREKLVGSGRQHAHTLYNVLVNKRDDKRLFGFYPTMASEIENYLYAKGTEAGLEFDSRPLVRFIPDPGLKKGRFDVIAEVVAAPIILKLREEELEYYGLAPAKPRAAEAAAPERSDEPEYYDDPEYYDELEYFDEPERSAAPERNYKPGRAAIPSPKLSAGGRPGSLENSSAENLKGLEVPVVFDNIRPDSSGLLPISQRKSVMGSQQDLSAKGAIPIKSKAAGGADFFGGISQEPLSVVGQACLINRAEQKTIRLEKRKLTVGRSNENDIVVADANASRIHARFSQDATGRWKVSDLGTTNGTQLNGHSVLGALLRSGDEITIGTTVFEFTE